MMSHPVDPLAGQLGLIRVRELGSGSFGSVTLYKQPHHADHQGVAVKFIRLSKTANHGQITREVRSHALLNHPHVIQFKRLGLTADGQYAFMVMEYADRGDLFNYVAKQPPLPEEHARWFFQQVIIGLDYCHKRGVCNRDLKLENLLLQRDRASPDYPEPWTLHVKLADFGLCKISTSSAPKSVVGTLCYIPPEVLLAGVDRRYDGRAADVWSAGVILYALLFKAYPFGVVPARADSASKKQLQAEVLRRIFSVEWHLPAGANISPACRDLLCRLLVGDPTKRATVEEVMRHPWFKMDLPPEAANFNATLVEEQLINPPMCEQSPEELEEVLQQLQEQQMLELADDSNEYATMAAEEYLEGPEADHQLLPQQQYSLLPPMQPALQVPLQQQQQQEAHVCTPQCACCAHHHQYVSVRIGEATLDRLIDAHQQEHPSQC